MAKSKSPLFGIDASGAIGDSVVYASWRGVKYARQYVVPSNPRTEEQMMTRSCFSFLNGLWAKMPGLGREPWRLYVAGKPMIDRNAFIKINLPQLREANSLNGFVASPGVAGGFPLVSFTVTGFAGQIQASAGVATLPAGWSVASVIFMVINQQDPHGSFSGDVLVQADTTAPYSVTFTGLSAGDYVVTAWAKYVRPDGKDAYGPSLIQSVTVS